MKRKLTMMAIAMMTLAVSAQKKWTLDECIKYAMENNTPLKMLRLRQQSAQEDVKQSKAALFPSLTANTSQNVGYSPFDDTNADKSYYSGSYALNAQWTVWNGGQNTNNIKLNKLTEQQTELNTTFNANTIRESIAQLYIQILYMTEAIEVNRQSLETSKKNEERGLKMLEVGKMSKADVAQLSAQRASSEYNIVEAETQLAKYKQKLKLELELIEEKDFDVAIPTTTDQQALSEIPDMMTVFEAARAQRPEIKIAKLDIESSKINLKIAKAGKLPTVTLNGNVNTSTNTMSTKNWGNQMKTGLGLSTSVNVSLPIFDGRRTKTLVNKARLEQENAEMALLDEEDDLYATIEGYWLDAVNNQQKFRAASASVESEQQSYDLLSEQFNLGLKNIVELLTGKDKLLSAQQNKLQSKYMTILSQLLLKFYQDGTIKI